MTDTTTAPTKIWDIELPHDEELQVTLVAKRKGEVRIVANRAGMVELARRILEAVLQ